MNANPKVQAVLRRLARDKAPETVAQLALWAAAGMDWDDVARLSRAWANPHEVALARQLLDDLGRDADPGRLLFEVAGKSDAQARLAAQVRSGLAGKLMLGLALEPGVPAHPAGPAVACRIQVAGSAEKPEALVQLACSDGSGSAWAPAGRFELPIALDDAGSAKLEGLGDGLAEGLLQRLVGVKLARAKSGAPKAQAYSIRLENYSPLMLNGIALAGSAAKPSEPAKALLGIALSPRRTMALPASAEAVERFGLKDGIKVLALDLSGL